jgi:uncharacterized protein involved in exopolysaccharide biosynthesis
MFRQVLWALPLLLVGMAVAFYLTRDIKRTYTGEGRLLVQIGQEYTFDSVTGQNGQNVMLTPDVISANETGIMKNANVIASVTAQMSEQVGREAFAGTFYKDIEKAERRGDRAAEAEAWVKLYAHVEKSFNVAPLPKSSIVDISYKHENGDVAVKTLNAFIVAYLDYRNTIFVDGSVDKISERLKATEEQMDENSREIQRFLKRHGISDYDSERLGVTGRLENLRAEMNTLRGLLSESEAALASVETQLRNTPEQINQYVDDRATQRVAQAELELKNLLSRYLPGSDPVRAKEAEIAQYKALQAQSPGQAIGGRRVGPNPVYQDLMTRRNLLQSTADSYREKEFALQRQLDAADAKVQKLTRLRPDYQTLLRERDVLDQRHRGYTTREQEALISEQQAQANSENIQVISRAVHARKGSNTRMIMFALLTAAWAGLLGIIALIRVFLDPAIYTRRGTSRDRRQDHGKRASYDRGASRDRTEQYAPPAQFVPEPVPSGPMPYVPPASAPAAYAPPQPPVQPAYGYSSTGSAALDVYQNPYGQSEPNAHRQGVPVLGVVPASEQG